MNVIFVEPSFPYNQREFVRALHATGATVIGIGERPVLGRVFCAVDIGLITEDQTSV